jgi:hypothetical protein
MQCSMTWYLPSRFAVRRRRRRRPWRRRLFHRHVGREHLLIAVAGRRAWRTWIHVHSWMKEKLVIIHSKIIWDTRRRKFGIRPTSPKLCINRPTFIFGWEEDGRFGKSKEDGQLDSISLVLRRSVFSEKIAQFSPQSAQNGALVNNNFCPKKCLVKIRKFYDKE